MEVNTENSHRIMAAELAWGNKDYICLLRLLRADSYFPPSINVSEVEQTIKGGKELKQFMEERILLHQLIEKGDLESIKTHAQSGTSSLYLRPDNQTALSCAIKNRQYDIYMYFLSAGAKLCQADKDLLGDEDFMNPNQLHGYSEDNLTPDENSHINKLEAYCKPIGELTEERKLALQRIFKDLNDVKFMWYVMRVLEFLDVEVMFNFESECMEQVCVKHQRAHGFTVTTTWRINIDAKSFETDETVYKKVSGTVAHKLCHLCMEAMYENNAKPYRKEDKEKEAEFERISNDFFDSFKKSEENFDGVIECSFRNYFKAKCHAELIASVPHILVINGESDGMEILQKQAPDFFKYIQEYVFPAFKKYTDPIYYERPFSLIEPLQKSHGLVKNLGEQISPLKEPTASFRQSLIPHLKMLIAVTSNINLCSWHAYNEFRRKYEFHLEKHCLFFHLDCFDENRETILSAFKCEACHTLVLVAKEKVQDFDCLSSNFNWVKEGEQKEVILILDLGSNSLSKVWKVKSFHYYWEQFSESFINELREKTVNYQGVSTKLKELMNDELASKVINPQVLSYLTSKETLQLGDKSHLKYYGYTEDLFIKRKFWRYNAKTIIENTKDGQYFVFITGAIPSDLEAIGFDEEMVQILDVTEGLDADKRIALPKRQEDSEQIFEKTFPQKLEKTSLCQAHWIHFYGGKFYWKCSVGQNRENKNDLIKELRSEDDLIDLTCSKGNRVILISDDPGCGKTIAISHLIREMKIKCPWVFVWRMNLSDYVVYRKDQLSLDNVNESDGPEKVFEYFLKVLKLQNPLEQSILESYRNIPYQCRIFFDGLDEISPHYREKAMKLLHSLLRVTKMQLWVTTWTHKRLSLEMEVDAVSFSMEEIAHTEKVLYLSEFWKRKLMLLIDDQYMDGGTAAIANLSIKIEAISAEVEKQKGCDLVDSLRELKSQIDETRGEGRKSENERLANLRRGIKDLKFESFAKALLVNVRSVILDHEKSFMGIPLHLSMLADVVYQENLRPQRYFNLFYLYSHFVEKKTQIYLMEKRKIDLDILGDLYNVVKEALRKVHCNISACVVNAEEFPWNLLKLKEVKNIVQDVGLVTKVQDHYEFIHRTFADYFFCVKILKLIESGKIDDKMLEKIFLEDKYSAVLRMLDGVFQCQEFEDTVKSEEVDKWNLTELFKNCIWKAGMFGDLTGKDVLRVILAKYTPLSSKFIPDVAKFINLFSSVRSFNKGYPLRLLSFCLTDQLLSELFDTHSKHVQRFVSLLIYNFSPSDLSELSLVYKRVSEFQTSLPNTPKITGTGSLKIKGNAYGSGKLRLERQREKRLRLLHQRDKYGNNVLLRAARKNDGDLLVQMIRFLREFLGEKGTRKLLKRCISKQNILGVCLNNAKGSIIEVLLEIESFLNKESIEEMIKDRVDFGLCLLRYAAMTLQCEEFDALLNHIIRILGVESLARILDEGNRYKNNKIWCLAAKRPKFCSFVKNMRKLLDHTGVEDFTDIAKGCVENHETIFHIRAFYERPLSDLIALKPYVGMEKFCKLLTKKNDKGMTCLHELFSRCCFDKRIKSDLKFVCNILGPKSFLNLLMAKDVDGSTVLHFAARHNMCNYRNEDILRLLGGNLYASELQNLVETTNKKGERIDIVVCDGSVELKIIKMTL